ncbi:hypothetical protein CKQ90_35350, partial [Klebsiella pneumoniae]
SLRLLESGEWQPQVAAIEAQLQAELAPARGSALVAGLRGGRRSLRLLESGEWQPQVAAIEAQLQAELAPARGSAL